MKEKDIAEKIAKDMTAVGSNFIVKKTLQLKKEAAVTRDSLENARRIKDAGYRFVKGRFIYNSSRADWWMSAIFKNEDGHMAEHEFLGFSIGYSGEGSRGMVELGDIVNLNFDASKILEHGVFPDKGTLKLPQDLK